MDLDRPARGLILVKNRIMRRMGHEKHLDTAESDPL